MLRQSHGRSLSCLPSFLPARCQLPIPTMGSAFCQCFELSRVRIGSWWSVDIPRWQCGRRQVRRAARQPQRGFSQGSSAAWRSANCGRWQTRCALNASFLEPQPPEGLNLRFSHWKLSVCIMQFCFNYACTHRSQKMRRRFGRLPTCG